MLVILAVFIVLNFWLFSMKLALLHNFWLLTAFVVYAVPNNCTFGMYEIAITRLGRVRSVGSGRSGPVGRVRSVGSGPVGRVVQLLSIKLQRLADSQLESNALRAEKPQDSRILTLSERTFSRLVE